MDQNVFFTIENTKFVDQLKADTQDAHKALERLNVSKSIVSSLVTKDQYIHYLNMMADVVSEVETHVFPLLNDLIPNLHERKKSEFLKLDFEYLNFAKRNPIKVFKNTEMTIPFTLGMMYVVEGATLGGRYILQNISVLGVNEENGARYFAGYGNKTGKYWKQFLDILTKYEQENNCGAEIIAGAEFAFKSIYNHFLNTPNEI